MIALSVLILISVALLYWKGSSGFVALFSGSVIAAFALTTTTLAEQLRSRGTTEEAQGMYLAGAFAIIALVVAYLLNVSFSSYRSHSHDALYAIVMGVLFSGLVITVGYSIGFYNLFSIPSAIAIAFQYQYAFFAWIGANLVGNWFLRR